MRDISYPIVIAAAKTWFKLVKLESQAMMLTFMKS